MGVRRSGVGVEKMLYNLRWYLKYYEALHVHKSGVYDCENVRSTKVLVTDKKICSKHLFGTRLEFFSTKTSKSRIQIRMGGGDWKIE